MNTFEKERKRQEPTFQRALGEDFIEVEGLGLRLFQLSFGRGSVLVTLPCRGECNVIILYGLKINFYNI